MNYLEFLASMFNALAWPVVVLFSIYYFKDSIKKKIDELRKGKISKESTELFFTTDEIEKIEEIESKSIDTKSDGYHDKVFSMLHRKINEVFISRFGQENLSDDILKTVDALVVSGDFKDEIYDSVEKILEHKKQIHQGDSLLHSRFMLRTVNLASQIENSNIKDNIRSELARIARNHKNDLAKPSS